MLRRFCIVGLPWQPLPLLKNQSLWGFKVIRFCIGILVVALNPIIT